MDSATIYETRARVRVLAFLLLAALTALVRASELPTANPAVTPTDRPDQAWWVERHAAVLEAVRSNPGTELLLIGDSITNNYDKSAPPDENFQPTWNEFYAPRHALNLGFSGDNTAHVLWRLEHGEVQGLHPKVAIVLIGTNNTARGHTAEQTQSGIDAVVAELEQRLPTTRILLLGILPSAVSEAKTQVDRRVNQALALTYAGNPRVTYLDIGSIFYRDRALRNELFYDERLPQPRPPLHPDTNGQRMMAEAIEPTLARLLEETPRVPLASMSSVNTAVIPVERLEQDSYDWYVRHHAVLQLRQTAHPDVVLIGDSITHFWAGEPLARQANGPNAWRHAFGALSVINLGFGWDRTQNVLWRLRQGELDGIAPRWVILEIGTNNLTGTEHARANTPEEVAAGIDAICAEIRERSPRTRIVLMAILPRGARPADPLREPIQRTNRLLAARYTNDPHVRYLDIGAKFLAQDGALPPSLMPDGTHPSDTGYQIWADALIAAGVRP
jgi:lysophospholipase L1-like esterase